MLAIRMQRVGRKGHPEYRVVVQDARLTPTSGRVVAKVGHVNPHAKTVTLDKEKVEFYLKNGARPSGRVVRVLQSQKVSLPAWVELPATDKKRSIKNTEKLRRNLPAEPEAKEEPVAAEEPVVETEQDVETTPEVTSNEEPAVESAPAEPEEA